MAALFVAVASAGPLAADSPAFPAIGSIERFTPAMEPLLATDAVIERLTEDTFRWSEGPVWVPGGDYLLFSDVPENRVWKWSEASGLEEFLHPSALSDGRPANPSGPGSNGLALTASGTLLAADHGSRSLISVNLASRQKALVLGAFEGKRFNSPNDLVISRTRWPGTIFFTDPPYGLKGQDDSPLRELPSNGVYRLDPSGSVDLLADSLGRPNGIALSPDERTLYVANSEKEHAVWMAYDLDARGQVSGPGRLFASAQQWADAGDRGLPDGMAVDQDGNVWATGPGGVFVIDPQGAILGRIRTGSAVANCAFGGTDGSMLYMTSAAFLARVATLSRGLDFDR
jgi:gluconolactonase